MKNLNECPKCGSKQRDLGKVFPAGVLWDVRFKSDSKSMFSAKQEVKAVACQSCGYIELFLAHPETGNNVL